MMMMILSHTLLACNKGLCLNKKQPTINHNLSAFGEEGMADETANEPATSNDAIGTADELERRQAPPQKFTMTVKDDWMRISAAQPPGQRIKPVPYTGVNEFFEMNMSERGMEGMKDVNGDIRYNKIFEWMLPTFDRKSI
jgi:hypothetical protein